MRRGEFEMSAAEAVSILKSAEYGVLSTVGNDEIPYGVPMNYVFDGDEILLHCALDGHKLDNIRQNDKVCFTVVGKARLIPERLVTAYESVIVFGKASLVSSDGEKREVLVKLIKRFVPSEQIERAMKEVDADLSKHGIIRIKIVGMSGKSRQ